MPTSCPVCGVSVKPENLERHIRKVHPRAQIDEVLTQDVRADIRRSQKPVGSSVHIPTWLYIVIAIVVTVGVVYVVRPYLFPPSSADTQIVTYCSSQATTLVAHYHPLLVINYNGMQQPLPYDPSQSADVGYLNQPGFTNSAYYCPSGEIHMLHTHDGSGIIHVEIPTTISSTPTLGEFFTIWGEPLSPAEVWSFSGTVKATMLNEDTGKVLDFSSDPAGIPFYEPAAGPFGNQYSIPQQYIFSGAYGSGQSSGLYSGEVIWLNVTA